MVSTPMNKTFRIKSDTIGARDRPPFVIAEIGTNHNRSLKDARRLIDVAAVAGCNCVKFQIYEPREIVSPIVRCSDYGLDKIYGDITAVEMFERHLKTPKEWFPELIRYSEDREVSTCATIHGLDGLRWANEIGFDAIKIASMDHDNLPLLGALVAEADKPVLISFGMGLPDEIDLATEVLSDHDPGVGVFHCVSVYPPSESDLRLSNIAYLSKRYGMPVGFSDHLADCCTAIAALPLGATFFEKHITLDRFQVGPDHHFALEPEQLREYVANLRFAAAALQGDGFIPPSEHELDNRRHYLKSIIAKKRLVAGHVIGQDDLYLARPPGGIPPRELCSLLGATVVADVIEADMPIRWAEVDAAER